jgi:hypothetical protein
MNPISFLVTNQRRSQNILLAVSRQSLTNYLLTVKQSWPCGLPQCDTLHSDTNISEKQTASVFNVKVCLPNAREADRFTTYGTGMTSSCITQSQRFMITVTRYIIWKPSLILTRPMENKGRIFIKKNILILGCLGDFGISGKIMLQSISGAMRTEFNWPTFQSTSKLLRSH